VAISSQVQRKLSIKLIPKKIKIRNVQQHGWLE